MNTPNEWININGDVNEEGIVTKSVIDKVLELLPNLIYALNANAAGVAILDYLMPGDWNGPQSESYENFREYIFEIPTWLCFVIALIPFFIFEYFAPLKEVDDTNDINETE